jgi:GTP-dependent phosphoenolpyruvate carboxykinase
MHELLTVDDELVKAELPAQHQHLARFGHSLPQALHDQLEAVESRLGVIGD